MAVKVTDCPWVDGFKLDVNLVVVGYLLTTCERAVEVLALNIASPALLAVRLCVPTVSVEVLNDVLRLESGAVPRTVAPCLNVIDSPSAGVPPRDVTEAGERDGLLLVNCYFDIRKRPCNIVTWVVQELRWARPSFR